MSTYNQTLVVNPIIQEIKISQNFYQLIELQMDKHSYSEAAYEQARSLSSQSIKDSSFHPKWLHDNNEESKLNSTIDHSVNRLPLNFFHSTSQYNKMLITYGKKRRQNPSAITDGLIKSLEYINDPIFEKQLQKKSKLKQAIIPTKITKKTINPKDCICCCCNQFCADCAGKNKTKKHKNNLSQSDLIRQRQKIHEQIKAIQNRSKRSKKQSLKSSKKSNRKQKHTNGQRIRSQIKNNYSSIGHSDQNAQVLSGSYVSRKSVNINNLLIKSMYAFQQKKKLQKLKQLTEANSRKAKQEYLKNLNEYIRRENQQSLKHQRSQKKQKQLAKNQLGLKYWETIKAKVFQQLKNDSVSASIKHQLNNYKHNVYQTIDIQKRKCSLSKEKIIQLRGKHELQTRQKLQMEAKIKNNKEKKIINNLRKLQRQRQKIISQCKLSPFNPTADMMTAAFKNIIQPTLLQGKNQQKLKKSYRGKQRGVKK